MVHVTTSNWSAIGTKLRLGGIGNPLKDLPTLSALLDVTENMMMESCKDEKERQMLQAKLYAPPVRMSLEAAPSKTLPKGFRPEDEMSAFTKMLDNSTG